MALIRIVSRNPAKPPGHEVTWPSIAGLMWMP